MTVVAIDGPGGSGKSTVAAALAERLGWAHLDTGAMYRAVALLALRRGVDPDDAAALGALAGGMRLAVGRQVELDGEDVSGAIRSEEVDAVVSRVAAHPEVRGELVRRQREWVAGHPDAVVEGRDIGSVVLPAADLKVFLTADPGVRAARRGAAVPQAVSRVAVGLAARDELDSSRGTSPLVVADGALVVDSSELAVDDVVARLLAAIPRGADPTPRATGAALPAPVRGPDGHPPASAPGRGALALYGACRVFAVGLSRLLLPGRVVGAELLPAGAYVLAPSHRSYLDWLVAARVTRRRLRFIVKEEVWRSRLAGSLAGALGAFPVQRGATDRQALNTALGVLEGGEPLVVFPEGTRQAGPEIGPLQEGAAYLALRAGVPIVPLALGGTVRALPRGRVLPRPVRVRILVGEPIDPAGFLAGSASERRRVPRSATRALNGLLRQRLQTLFDEAEAAGGR